MTQISARCVQAHTMTLASCRILPIQCSSRLNRGNYFDEGGVETEDVNPFSLPRNVMGVG